MQRRLLLSLPFACSASIAAATKTIAPRIRILVFGDSNTWGWRPAPQNTDLPRYSDAERWTGRLQAILGQRALVLTDGLMARTLNTDLAKGISGLSGEDHNGLRRFPLALLTQDPIHYVVVMLGTNDLMQHLGRPVAAIAQGIKEYAAIAAQRTQRHPLVAGPRLLVIAPAPLGDTSKGDFAEDFNDISVQKSRELPIALSRLAEEAGVAFASASDWIRVDGVDGLHLSIDAHQRLAIGVAGVLRSKIATIRTA